MIFGSWAGLALAMLVAHLVSFLLGRAFPKASLVGAALLLVLVIACWTLIAFGEFDGPGGALSIALYGMGSLLLLCAGTGMLTGSVRNYGASAGLFFGLGLGALLLVAFPTVRTTSVQVILIGSLAVGFVVGHFNRPKSPPSQR
jgi:hypothetical protein